MNEKLMPYQQRMEKIKEVAAQETNMLQMPKALHLWLRENEMYLKGLPNDKLISIVKACLIHGINPSSKQAYIVPMNGTYEFILSYTTLYSICEKTNQLMHYELILHPKMGTEENVWEVKIWRNKEGAPIEKWWELPPTGNWFDSSWNNYLNHKAGPLMMSQKRAFSQALRLMFSDIIGQHILTDAELPMPEIQKAIEVQDATNNKIEEMLKNEKNTD